jgi:hypothetical protein
LLSFTFRDRAFSTGYTRFKQEKIPPGAQPPARLRQPLSTVRDLARIPILRKKVRYPQKIRHQQKRRPIGRGVVPFIQPSG